MPELITRASWGQPRSPEEGPREGLERARTGNPGQGCGLENFPKTSGRTRGRRRPRPPAALPAFPLPRPRRVRPPLMETAGSAGRRPPRKAPRGATEKVSWNAPLSASSSRRNGIFLFRPFSAGPEDERV
jgi:hypothetical protein